MRTIWSLTISQQGRPDEVQHFFSRQAAEKERDADHRRYLMEHLTTANRIKGAIRGRGQQQMFALAAGIVAQRRTYTISQHSIHGGLEEESQ